jgi:hypothetical protein
MRRRGLKSSTVFNAMASGLGILSLLLRGGDVRATIGTRLDSAVSLLTFDEPRSLSPLLYEGIDLYDELDRY